MNIRKWHVYLTDLNPGFKAEPGKIRPAVVVQTDLLNNIHPSTIICPITTKVQKKASLLRVHIKRSEGGLAHASDVLVDQIRAIDNARFQKYLGVLNNSTVLNLKERLKLILD